MPKPHNQFFYDNKTFLVSYIQKEKKTTTLSICNCLKRSKMKVVYLQFDYKTTNNEKKMKNNFKILQKYFNLPIISKYN